MPLPNKSFKDILLELKIITPEQLKNLLLECTKTKKSMRQLLVEKAIVSDDNLTKIYTDKFKIPRANAKTLILDPNLMKLFPEKFMREHLAIPLFKSGEILTVILGDPFDIMTLDEIRLKTGLIVEIVTASKKEILQLLGQSGEKKGPVELEEIISSIDAESVKIEEGEEAEVSRLQNIAEVAPVIKLVNLIIEQAIRDKASDIHVEPDESALHVRNRIDGIMHETVTLPKNLQAAVLSRLKIMSDLNIAVKRAPQDGRFQYSTEGSQIDFRVSTFPTIYGENIVLRLLDASSVLIGMEELGFSKDYLKKFKSLIANPYGIILVTGPTGSGKTTTLYSALNTLKSSEKNIITVEDPVEYHLPGIRQSQINPKAGLTFATGLRSILRQDPDIIMVGEIRDLETAEISIQAALTGHLVLSTLHTNDAPGALTRLTDMKVEPFLISSSVVGILAQRLVRKICDNCKESYKIGKAAKDLGMGVSENAEFYRGKGCRACKNSGYKGRIGIFELMLNSDRIKELINTKSASANIKKVAQEEGMKTLREDGLDKVLAGLTTIEEVIRVTMME